MKYCALIVDDNLPSVMPIIAVLEKRDISCVHAMSSEEASQKIGEVMPHLLVVDISLGPNDSGLRWLKTIREGKFRNIPALMMTGSGEEDNVKESALLGVEDYIIKPAEPQVLEKKITAIIARLRAKNIYQFSSPENPVRGEVMIDARIDAISETGLAVSSAMINKVPLSFDDMESGFFNELQIAPPKKITFLNYERNSNRLSKMPIRNYCQTKGWTEMDFQKIRLWIRSNKLGKDF